MISFRIKLLFIALLFCGTQLNALIDLEDLSQEFVLETKKIDIPGYPDAFNPGIIRWRGSLLMSFRNIPNPKQSYTSYLGLVWLDEEFNLAGDPQILQLDKSPLTPSRAEDGRLLTVGDKLYIVYSDNKDALITRGGFRVYLAELQYDGQTFSVDQIECLSKYEGESKSIREKNWTPFDYEGTLLLAYSLDPHRIFLPIKGTGSCETIYTTQSDISWKWGTLRGSTPGILQGDEYLAFFHSSCDMATIHSEGKLISHYFIGAYIFSNEPPFEITKISPEPIIGKGFYKGRTYKPYWKPICAVFPCGYILDDHYIWVTYGRQDREVWIVKLDRKALFKSLIPVTLHLSH